MSVHANPQAVTIPMPVLEVQSLTKSYAARPILRDVSFKLNQGERVALLGPSGSGKTTVLNCVGGVDRADSGSVMIADRFVENLDADELAHLRRRHIGTVFQFYHLLPTLSAAENIELPLQLLGVATSERECRVRELLQRVGIAHRAAALPGQLSGGEMQRVAIARAVVHRPTLILADEPTGSLDTATGAHVLDLLAEIVQETQAALLLVTHSPEAVKHCERVLRMQDGQIVEGA